MFDTLSYANVFTYFVEIEVFPVLNYLKCAQQCIVSHTVSLRHTSSVFEKGFNKVVLGYYFAIYLDDLVIRIIKNVNVVPVGIKNEK